MDFPPDFTSDGCTWFPDVWRGIDLTACCREHDLAWFVNPGDWIAWAFSNLHLGACFYEAGAIEIAIPAMLAVSTIGALLFLRRITRN